MLLLQKLQQANTKFKGKFTYDMLQAVRVIDPIKVTCPIHGDSIQISEILFQVTILDGERAWNIEKQILRELKADRYIGPKIFKDTGNTEIFTTNPLNIITKVINEQLFSIQ